MNLISKTINKKIWRKFIIKNLKLTVARNPGPGLRQNEPKYSFIFEEQTLSY